MTDDPIAGLGGYLDLGVGSAPGVDPDRPNGPGMEGAVEDDSPSALALEVQDLERRRAALFEELAAARDELDIARSERMRLREEGAALRAEVHEMRETGPASAPATGPAGAGSDAETATLRARVAEIEGIANEAIARMEAAEAETEALRAERDRGGEARRSLEERLRVLEEAAAAEPPSAPAGDLDAARRAWEAERKGLLQRAEVAEASIENLRAARDEVSATLEETQARLQETVERAKAAAEMEIAIARARTAWEEERATLAAARDEADARAAAAEAKAAEAGARAGARPASAPTADPATDAERRKIEARLEETARVAAEARRALAAEQAARAREAEEARRRIESAEAAARALRPMEEEARALRLRLADVERGVAERVEAARREAAALRAGGEALRPDDVRRMRDEIDRLRAEMELQNLRREIDVLKGLALDSGLGVGTAPAPSAPPRDGAPPARSDGSGLAAGRRPHEAETVDLPENLRIPPEMFQAIPFVPSPDLTSIPTAISEEAPPRPSARAETPPPIFPEPAAPEPVPPETPASEPARSVEAPSVPPPVSIEEIQGMTDTGRVLEVAADLEDKGWADLAERAYDRVLALDPENHRALHNRGLLAVNNGRYDEAEEFVRRAIASAPPQAAALSRNLLAQIRSERPKAPSGGGLGRFIPWGRR